MCGGMPRLYSGKDQNMAYSLSRWTDLVASKWDWFRERLDQGQMLGVDPRTGMPLLWSLRPDETLGLIFWTRQPKNLIRDAALFKDYQKTIHFTLTGWHEVEHKAPNIELGLDLLAETCETFGAENVTWRFSPVPVVDSALGRFYRIAEAVQRMGIKECYVSFLQTNDNLTEPRSVMERVMLLDSMAQIAPNLQVKLCNEDRTLRSFDQRRQSDVELAPNLSYGICEDSKKFALDVRTEGCGCALSVDPFTITETCRFGCEYCLDPETPVLTSDHVWMPLKDVREGDILLGFDEYPPGPWKKRKYRKAKVEGVYSLERECLRLTLSNGTEVVTSEDHLWLTGESRKMWTPAKKLSFSHKLLSVTTGVTSSFTLDVDYYAGYLTGMTTGDGTFRLSKEKQSYWRVALADMEPLARTQEALTCFGIELGIKPFDSGSSLTVKPMYKLETRKKSNLEKISSILEEERHTISYYRGFLAGAFDAEGSFNRNLRIYQVKGNDTLARCQRYASYLGVPMDLEDNAVRSTGEHRNRLRFFAETRPSLARKRDFLIGKMADFEPVSILKIERLGPRPVIDIKTSTATFMAAGLATHNCYAADKTLSPKKKNTTKKRLPMAP